MYNKIFENCRRDLLRRPESKAGFFLGLAIAMLLIAAPFAGRADCQGGQKSSSIVIHDRTNAAAGGEKATQGLRDEFKSELERQKPCVETFDDQDLRDAINDEREREMMEGGEGDEQLRAIGDKLNSNLVAVVQAMSVPGSPTTYSGFVMDMSSGRAIGRRVGSEKDVADGLVQDIASRLADNCKPHWVGTVRMVYSQDETKTVNDEGAAHAARQNVKRVNKQTSKFEVTITANLISTPPGGGARSVNSPMARVAHRTLFNYVKSSNTSGQQRCREPGKNPYLKGFSEEYSESTRQVGRATENMPVGIMISSDGTYTIVVAAPGGVIVGGFQKRESHATCADSNPTPEIEAMDMPEGKLLPTSFTVEGKTDPKNRDTLSGSKTLADGKTTYSWNLRLVKPKGK